MTDAVVVLPDDSSNTGKKIDESSLTVGADTVLRQRVVIADSSGAAGFAPVDATNGLSVNLTGAGGTNFAAQAKGAQAANFLPTQDAKDTGRTHINLWANGAAAGATGTETAITLTKSSGTSATTSAASFVVTSGKAFRITSVTFASRGNATATTQVTTFSLRINTGGAVTREQHEQFARAFERYLMEGRAPTQALAEVFAKFKQWLTTIYRRVSGLAVPINDDIRGVFDRLIAKEPEETTVAGAVKPKTPWRSETLQPRRDLFGEPNPSTGAVGAGGLAQTDHDEKMRNDPVRQEMLRLGVVPVMPERTILGVALSDKQYDDFARISGRLMKIRLDQIMRLPGFNRLSDATQRALFDDAVAGSRDAASSLIMMQNPSIITAAIKAKLASLASVRQPTRQRAG